MQDGDGAQLVTIGRYAYRWPKLNRLEVGEKVVCPGSYWSPDPWIGEVTALGSSWDGDHLELISRYEP